MKKYLLPSVVSLALISPFSFAYETFECSPGVEWKWGTNAVTISAQDVEFDSGSTWGNALGKAVDIANRNPSPLRYSLSYGDTSMSFNNNQSEVWWSSVMTNPGFIAEAWFWGDSSTCEIDEADMRYLNTVDYTASNSKAHNLAYGGSKENFQLIALHEIGHTMGLDHTTSVASIMGGGTYTTTNGSLVYPGLGEDASTALYDMYGANSGNIEDLAVNHWRHTGSSGGYATHGRTRLFTTGGSVVASTWVDDEPIYDVQPGSTYKVEFSFENNGENAQYIDAGFYISTNAFISTSDRLIRTKPMVLVRNASPSLRQSTITIPSDLTVNEDYYLGVRIDDGNILSEESETNNATYVGIRTY